MIKTCENCMEEHQYPSVGGPTSICIDTLTKKNAKFEKRAKEAEAKLKLAAIADLTHGTMGNVLDLEAQLGDAATLVRELKRYIQDPAVWKESRQAELWAKVENFLERAKGVEGPS